MPSAKLALKSRRRLLFLAAFGVFVAVQGFYSFELSPEPYPSIRMPSFGVAPDTEGHFRSRVLTISIRYEDGSVVFPMASELMQDFRFSAARPSLDYMFLGEEARVDDQVLRWLRKQGTRLGNGSEPTVITFSVRATSVDIRTAKYLPGGEIQERQIRL